MNVHYEQLQAMLRERGLTTRREVDRFGPYLVIPLEAPSELSVIDLKEGGHGEVGLCLEHTTLSQDSGAVVYEDSEYDVPALVNAISEFITRRNREHLADELRLSLDDALCNEWLAELHEGSGEAWVLVWSPVHDDEAHLRVATYPAPGQGVNTDGTVATGWRVSIHRRGQEPPHEVLYDAPGNADVRPMLVAITAWVYPTDE